MLADTEVQAVQIVDHHRAQRQSWTLKQRTWEDAAAALLEEERGSELKRDLLQSALDLKSVWGLSDFLASQRQQRHPLYNTQSPELALREHRSSMVVLGLAAATQLHRVCCRAKNH